MSTVQLYKWTSILSSEDPVSDFGHYEVSTICAALEISESGYYSWLRTKDEPTSREILSAAINKVLAENDYNRNYGAQRMKEALDFKGVHKSVTTVRDQMGIMGLLHHKRRPRGCTKASKEEKEAQDLIKQDFTAEEPLRKVLTDVTVIDTANGKLYLAVALDCYSGEIIAMEMRDNMRKGLCISLIEQIKAKFGSKVKGMIVHSDRGAQYTSEEYKNTLSKAGMRQSLCGEYHCFANSRMESFWATLKKELIYQMPTYKMPRSEVETRIFRYVFTYYNRERLTSENPGWLPPSIYRERQMANSNK